MTGVRLRRRPGRRRFQKLLSWRWRILSVVCLILVLLAGWQLTSAGLTGVGRLVGLAPAAGASPGVQLRRTYVVAPGDTLSGIARRFGVSTQLLIRTNHLTNANVIVPGQSLILPSPYHPALTKQLVESTSATFHVDPAFATAVAYQESGFNENVVSPTGAIGVMQVEPGTASLVARQLGRSFDLGIESDNVAVGVYWLAYLVRYYGGNEQKAAAAYYEGQDNLARHGYLAGTQQYVNSVMALRRHFGGR